MLYLLEDVIFVSDVNSRSDSRSSGDTGSDMGNDTTVQVWHDHDVELPRVFDQLIDKLTLRKTINHTCMQVLSIISSLYKICGYFFATSLVHSRNKPSHFFLYT